jgi:hypothetical protein
MKAFQPGSIIIRAEPSAGQLTKLLKAEEVLVGFSIFWLKRNKELN